MYDFKTQSGNFINNVLDDIDSDYDEVLESVVDELDCYDMDDDIALESLVDMVMEGDPNSRRDATKAGVLANKLCARNKKYMHKYDDDSINRRRRCSDMIKKIDDKYNKDIKSPDGSRENYYKYARRETSLDERKGDYNINSKTNIRKYTKDFIDNKQKDREWLQDKAKKYNCPGKVLIPDYGPYKAKVTKKKASESSDYDEFDMLVDQAIEEADYDAIVLESKVKVTKNNVSNNSNDEYSLLSDDEKQNIEKFAHKYALAIIAYIRNISPKTVQRLPKTYDKEIEQIISKQKMHPEKYQKALDQAIKLYTNLLNEEINKGLFSNESLSVTLEHTIYDKGVLNKLLQHYLNRLEKHVLRTAEDCDDFLTLIKRDQIKYNKALETIADARVQYAKNRIDAKEYKKIVAPAAIELKGYYKTFKIKISDITGVKLASKITKEDVVNFKHYVSGLIIGVDEIKKKKLTSSKNMASANEATFEEIFNTAMESLED